MRIVVLVTALLLAGCMSAEEQRAADDKQCLSYGFAAGTDAFAQCRLQLDLQRQQIMNQNLAIQRLTPLNCIPVRGATTCF